MVAEPAVAQAANRPIIPMAEGLGPQELYDRQLEGMLCTLAGRLLLMGLCCWIIAGWLAGLLGMALMLLLGWRQILRHKDRPDLLRYNYHRTIWGLVIYMTAPLLIRLLYAGLQAWAPDVLDAWLQFTTPVVEHLSGHLALFQEVQNWHAKLYATADPVNTPRLDLALHMVLVHCMTVPAVLLFGHLLACNFRPAKAPPTEYWLKVLFSNICVMLLGIIGLWSIQDLLGESVESRIRHLSFRIHTNFFVQIFGFTFVYIWLWFTLTSLYLFFYSAFGNNKFKNFYIRHLSNSHPR